MRINNYGFLQYLKLNILYDFFQEYEITSHSFWGEKERVDF